MNISETSVRRPVTVVVLFSLLIAISMFMIPELAVEMYPDATPPRISIQTVYPGASPEEVEEDVTDIIESELSSISGLDEMTSTSSENQSAIVLEFDFDVDLDEATDDINDALEKAANNLPDDANSPIVMQFDMSSEEIMRLVIEGDDSPDNLKILAEDTVQPHLERIDGVASADVSGGDTKVIAVDVSLNRLEAYNLSLSDISNAISDQNLQMGGGSLTREGIEYELRVDEKFKTLEDVRRVVVASLDENVSGSVNRSTVVRLEDVADVSLGVEDSSSIVYINGKKAIILEIMNESDSNTVDIAEDVYAALPEINKALPTGISVSVLYDETTMIGSLLDSVYTSAFQGLILAMIVLFLFLRNVRSTLIIGLSIPISLALTLMFMYFFDLTLNMISITGLILGLGMIVDSSIVILENIFSYRERGARLIPSAILGSKEMTTAIVTSTLTTLCVFIPMIIWKDDLKMIGSMFSDLIFTVVISLSISLVVAVTLVPALSSSFLKLYTRKQRPLKNKVLIAMDSFLAKIIEGMEQGYKRALTFAMVNKGLVVTFIAMLFILAVVQFSNMGMTFMPSSSDDDSVKVTITMPVGTSLDRTDQSLISLKSIIENEIEGYENIILTVGSEGGQNGEQTYVGSIEITLPPLADQIESAAEVKDKLRPFLNQIPEAQIEFSAGRGPKSGSAVDVVLYGDNIDTISDFSREIRDLLDDEMPQIVDPVSSLDGGVPEYQIVIDKDRASALGISVTDVATAVDAYIDGIEKTTMWWGSDELDVLVRLQEEDRNSIPDLDSMFISSASGEQIALSNLASFVEGTGTENITHSDKTKVGHVTADLIDGVTSGEIQGDIESLIEDSLVIPNGVTIEFDGDSRSLSEMKQPFMIILAVAFLLVFGVMASLFESLKDPFIIFLSIPLLLIGVVGIYMITGETFSLFSAIGIVVLLGIVVNNGIVLVDYTNLLRHRGMPLVEACIEAGRSRFRPVLMSTLTTVLGMIPLGFFPAEGTDMIRPIAQTIVGGLTVNTVLTLFLTPVMYSVINKNRNFFRKKDKLNKEIETAGLEVVK